MRTHEAIPADFEVQPVPAGTKGESIATDGYCGLSWDDSIVTDWTPVPSARCPFEYFHVYPDEVEPTWSWMWLDAEHIADLTVNIAAVIGIDDSTPSDQLVGIVDDAEGGIVAYAIGPGNASRIVEALNTAKVPA